MSKVNELWWFTEQDYESAIKWRKDGIESARREIVKHQKQIEKWEGEIYHIEERMKNNLDRLLDIEAPVLKAEN